MKSPIIIFILALSFSCSTGKQELYEWRGPGRTGIYPESNLLKEWPEGGPSEVFTIDSIGNGFGSPIVTDDAIYITGEIDSMAVLQAYNTDGSLKWKTILGREWTESYPGSRSAPTLYRGLLYVGTGMGDLFCVEKEKGRKIWSRYFEKDFGGIYPLFGHSEAPVVFEDMVFWTAGGPEKNVVALNVLTGAPIWSNKGFGERSGYNQPALINLPDRSIFVTFSAYHMMGFDCETGELLWSHEQDNFPPEERKPGNGDTHGNTIIYDNGYIYYAEGDGNCGVKLKLSQDGSVITEIWRNKDFDSYMGGIVKIGNYLYGCGTAKNRLVSIDAESGAIADSLRIGRGVVISADMMLYYYTDTGKLKLVSVDKGKMKEISSFQITKGSMQHFSHPVIQNGILYLRHGNSLMAYNIRSKE
ncbi:MAG: PQQ-like beta-propeller repeat protein [Bacteroidales bacterium]|nr:PQQ-like beta-propeller repeat protein [Bacteroidales bacterium]MCB9013964.1 PQQ-like beta-propeller repeat protein [Bacteroidales bacterium]